MNYFGLVIIILIIRSSEAATDTGTVKTSKIIKTTLDLTSMLQATTLYGEDAGMFSAPWMVSISLDTVAEHRKGFEHRCSGIILNEYKILTSTQCVKKLPKHSQIVIVAGLYNLNNIGSADIQIRYPIQIDDGNHQPITDNNSQHNLTLARLILSTKLEFSNKVQPIDIVKPHDKFSTSSFAYQYGWSNNKQAAYLSDLQVSTRNLTNQVGCEKFEGMISNQEFCVPSIACNTADHGSPLMQINELGIMKAIGIWNYDLCDKETAVSIFIYLPSFDVNFFL